MGRSEMSATGCSALQIHNRRLFIYSYVSFNSNIDAKKN